MTPTLEILKETPHWSFSSLNTLLNICSLQWRFKYIDKLEPETSSICFHFGNAFHKAVNELIQGQNMAEVHSLFSNVFKERCSSDGKLETTPEEIDSYIDKGCKMLIAYAENRPQNERVIEVEKAFSIPLPNSNRRLVGEFDAVVRNDENQTVILDFKTAGAKWPNDKADKDLQATLYSYAAEQLGIVNPLFRYDVVTKTKSPNYTGFLTHRNNDDFKRMFKMIDAADKLVKNEVFYPNEGCFSCATCPYGTACRKWHSN